MSNVPKTHDDEIDLLSLIETVLDGKWKIIFIMIVSVLLVFVFNNLKSNNTFIAMTEIKPITSYEFDKYRMFNSSLKTIQKEEKENKENKEEKILTLFEVTQQYLLDLYIEEIKEGSLLEIAIEKFKLINKDDFDSEDQFKDAIEKFASEIQVISPIKEKNSIRLHHTLSAKYNDRYKWKKLLTFVNNEANLKVKRNIITRFETIISIQNRKQAFAIKDLNLKITNEKSDFDRYTKDRLAFLREQAAIARKLDIKKNTIYSQRSNAQNMLVTSIKTDNPFYLRGYLAIEEEIKQISNRKNKDAFNSKLFAIEQQKRNIEQDQTIKRATDLFVETPLNRVDFNATIVKVATTSYTKIKDKKNLYIALAIILGGIIGVTYVLITNALQNRKNNTVST